MTFFSWGDTMSKQTKPRVKANSKTVERIPAVFRAPCIFCGGVLDIRYEHELYPSGSRAHIVCVREVVAERWRAAQEEIPF